MSRLAFAFNTNGLAHHRLPDAAALVADHGYDGLALTLDHQHLDPFAPQLAARTAEVAHLLSRNGLRVVVETGARFLLDSRNKHEPTLISAEPEGRARRLAFLTLAADIAADLGAEAVSCFAGVPADGVDRGAAWEWLVDGIQQLLEHARRVGVTIAVEPEPGMLVETTTDWRALAADVGSGRLTMALDVGHCLVAGDEGPAEAVVEHADRLGTVTVDDMRRGVHEHLPFGSGDLDLDSVLTALHRVHWTGLVCVELSRDSHRADRIVPDTIAALRSAEAHVLIGAAP